MVRSTGHLEPARPLSFLRESSWGTSGLPCVPPLIIDGEWLKSVLSSSSVGGPTLGWIPRGVHSVTASALAPSPAPGGAVPPRGPPHTPAAEGDAEDVLRRARERRALREEFLQGAADVVSRIGAELAVEDARLEAEGLRLAEERRKLKVAIALARHQR